LCSALSLTALTLGPKLAYYTRGAAEAERHSPYEAKIESFLTGLGWSRIGALDLVIGIEQRAMRYVAASCAGEVRIAVVPPSGEANGLVKNALRGSERLFFVHEGTASEEPPRYAYLKEKLGQLSESIGLTFFRRSPYLAVSEPSECRLESEVPWHLL
jgi:hypothetical protein